MLVTFPERISGFAVIPTGGIRQTAQNSSSFLKKVSKSSRAISLPSVLIPVVVSFARIPVLQFLHLRYSVKGSSFDCFLQETIVDVWENGKCRPFRITKPYLDPVVPEIAKTQVVTSRRITINFPAHVKSQTKYFTPKCNLFFPWPVKIVMAGDQSMQCKLDITSTGWLSNRGQICSWLPHLWLLCTRNALSRLLKRTVLSSRASPGSQQESEMSNEKMVNSKEFLEQLC